MKSRLLINVRTFWVSAILTMLFTALLNNDLGAISYLYWGVTLGCCALLIVFSGKIQTVRLDAFLGWYLIFVALSALSMIWSVDRESSMDYFKSMIVNVVVLMSVNSVIYDEEDLAMIMRALYIAIIINALYLMVKLDWNEIGTDRIGTEHTGEGWNANGIGMMAVWGIALAIIMPRKKRMNPLALVWLIPLVVILVFSASRKAWLAAVLVCLLGLFVYNRRHMLRNILLAAGIVALIVYLVMNVPVLYELGGQRFEGLLAALTGEGEADSSTLLRQKYTELGLEWFAERPVLGYGLNTYRYLLKMSYIGKETYSHNNYVELLINGGIIVAVAFYFIYAWGIIKGCKQSLGRKKALDKQSRTVLFFVGLLVLQLGMQFGMVAYYDLQTLIIIMLLCKMVNMYSTDRSLQPKTIEKTDLAKSGQRC